MDTTLTRAPIPNDRVLEVALTHLDDTYELVHVDYRHSFTDVQVGHLVRKDWDALQETIDDWESEARYEGAKWHIDEYVLPAALATLVESGEIDKDDADDVRDDFLHTDEWDELRYAIEERDTSDPIADLASNTGRVLLRVPLYGSEDDYFTFHAYRTGDDSDDASVDDVLAGSGIADTPKNRQAVAEIADETGHDHKWPFLLFAVDVGTLYDLLRNEDTTHVLVKDPHLLLTNIYAGDGHEEQIEGEYVLGVDSLRTDEDAPGYSWDSIAGVVISYYESEISAWNPWQQENAA